MYESSDSESPPCSSAHCRREEAVIRLRTELARAKREIKELNDQLLQAESGEKTNEQKYEDKVKELYKAKRKIEALEKLCEKWEEETFSLKASLEEMSGRMARSNERLESSEKECSRLNSEKSQLEEKVTILEKEVRELKRRLHAEEQLLPELEHLRSANYNLRMELAAVRENEQGVLTELCIEEEESQERMIFDRFESNGINLSQELAMFGSSLAPTVPSREDILEGEDAAGIDATTQTERLCVANSSTQFELLPSTAGSMETQERHLSNAAVQVVNVPPNSYACASTQTAASNLGNASMVNNGMAAAQQPYPIPYQSFGYTNSFCQPVFLEREFVDVDNSHNFRTRWICIMAVLFLIFAYFGNGGQIDITPLVNFFRGGLKYRYKKGIPPY